MIGRSRVERDGGEFFQIFLVGNALEIEQQQLYFGVFGDRDREFADRISASLPVAWVWRTPMPRWRRNPTGTVDNAPLWLSIATWPFGTVHIHEHGGEACNRAGAEIGKPLRIRPDDAHAGLVRGLDHPPLFRLAGDGIDLAESRRHHHRDLDAVRGAILHRADGVVAGDRDDHHFGRLRQIGQALVAFVALHLGRATD